MSGKNSKKRLKIFVGLGWVGFDFILFLVRDMSCGFLGCCLKDLFYALGFCFGVFKQGKMAGTNEVNLNECKVQIYFPFSNLGFFFLELGCLRWFF